MNISSLDDAYGGEGAISMSNEPPQPPTSHEFLNPPPPQINPAPKRAYTPPAPAHVANAPPMPSLRQMQEALESGAGTVRGVGMQKRKHNPPYSEEAPTRRRTTRGDTRQRFFKKIRDDKKDETHKKAGGTSRPREALLDAEKGEDFANSNSNSNNKRMGIAVIIAGCVFILVLCILFAILRKRRRNNANTTPAVLYGSNDYNYNNTNHNSPVHPFPPYPLNQAPPPFAQSAQPHWMYNTSPPLGNSQMHLSPAPTAPTHMHSQTNTGIPQLVGDNTGVLNPMLTHFQQHPLQSVSMS